MLARTLNAALLLLVLFCLPGLSLAAPITGGTGPGGFILTGPTSDLTAWLKGDAGITKDGADRVSAWNDQSGRNNHFTQANINNQPLQNVALNGVPLLNFDGGTQLADSDFMVSAGSVDARTILIVNRPTGTPDQPNPVVGNTTSFLSIRRRATIWRDPSDSDTNDFTNPTGSTFRVDGAIDNVSTVGIAQQLAAERSSNFSFDQLQLARHSSFENRAYQGHIGEVVVLNRVLTNTERVIMENHLAAKWDLPLNTAGGALDLYQGKQAAFGNYDFDVFGIGNDGASAVLTSGSAGFGIEVTDGSLTANRWVLAGHKVANNSLAPVETGGGIFGGERWDRTWFVDVTGEGINANLAFDFSDAGLGSPLATDEFTLLYREEEAFDWTLLSASASVAGDLVVFNVAALQDGYYTLGLNIVSPIIPEPSSLLLLGVGSVLTLQLCRRRRRDG